MLFTEFIAQSPRSYESIAHQLGVSRSTINHIMTGRRKPSLKLCRRIVQISQGRVTSDELLYEFGI